MKISTFMGAPKEFDVCCWEGYLLQNLSQFLDNLFLKEFMVLERTKGKQDFGIQQMK
jgi:hypothetical protein